MTNPHKIAFLGAGNMASALIHGAVERASIPASHLGITDVRKEATAQLEQRFGVRPFPSNIEACLWADVIVLAVKPQVLNKVLDEIAAHLHDGTLVLSIVAGVTIAQIATKLGGHGRIVRAMPNTPALVGEGATAIAGGPLATADDLETCESLFRATGLVVRTDERLLDAVTGLSGSGPAYAFVAIEALSDAGVRAGLPRDVATRLAAQTLLGAAKMVLETGEHPARLKDMVTSPAGTTIAGLAALEREGLRYALHAAVEAATARSKELGGD